MSRQFDTQLGATRIVFASGAITKIRDEIAALGLERVAVISTPGRRDSAEDLAKRLDARAAGVIALGREHVPRESVEQAGREIERLAADSVLAIGGGSAIGLAKALALRHDLRIAVAPTTYSGSEMTSIYGMTDGGEKKTGRDERVRPILVIYDPILTLELPRETTILSLWNAAAHAIEALWTEKVAREVADIAERALGLVATSLSRLAAASDDLDARESALEGAYLAGAAFDRTGSGIHHKLCHVLGGMFGLPHAATHAALLPHVVRSQSASEPAAMAAIARALAVVDPVAGIADLGRVTGAPRDLASLGMPREGIERAAAAPALAAFDRAKIVRLLTSAWRAATSQEQQHE